MATEDKCSIKAAIYSLVVLSLVVFGSMFSHFTILDFFYLIVIIVSVIRYILIKRKNYIIL